MFNNENEKYVFSKETAKIELQKMFDYYEIDVDDIEDKELKKAIRQGYDRLIKAVRLGRLEVKIEDGIKVIQNLRSGTVIEYKEIDGESKSAMDSYPPEAYNRRAQALMGALSGDGEAAMRKLKGPDLSLMEMLGLIFLAV